MPESPADFATVQLALLTVIGSHQRPGSVDYEEALAAWTRIEARLAETERERDAFRAFVEHVNEQRTILVGNPYGSLARAALAEQNVEEGGVVSVELVPPASSTHSGEPTP